MLPESSQIITTLAFALFAFAGVLYFMPVGECPVCPHCANERRNRAAKKERERHDWFHRMYGKEGCPTCHRKP